jgi:hypothetical protein
VDGRPVDSVCYVGCGTMVAPATIDPVVRSRRVWEEMEMDRLGCPISESITDESGDKRNFDKLVFARVHGNKSKI